MVNDDDLNERDADRRHKSDMLHSAKYLFDRELCNMPGKLLSAIWQILNKLTLKKYQDRTNLKCIKTDKDL